MLIINYDEVRRLLTMSECIEAVAEALRVLDRGDAIQPLRSVMRLPRGERLLGLMPAYLGHPPVLGIKVITVFPGNHGTQLDAHQGAVLLFDTTDGRLLAVLDATEITAMRTAAASALATRVLSREDSARLALLGSGTQAQTHLEALLLVRPISSVSVWSREHRRAAAFAERARKRTDVEVEAVESARAAVEGADIVCTVTTAREPILAGEWLEPGMHVNAVGACLPDARELDTEAVRCARLFVDSRVSALNEAGDFLIPRAQGAFGDEHILAELGQVMSGAVAGRTGAQDITLFKSLGLAVEDLAAAHRIYVKASAQDATTDIGFTPPSSASLS